MRVSTGISRCLEIGKHVLCCLRCEVDKCGDIDEYIHDMIKIGAGWRLGAYDWMQFMSWASLWKEKIMSDDEKASQCDGGIMTAVTTNPINESS
ncbi:hypothetical protein M8C21_022683, partial [Ambrosia artemisiifolia]